MVQLKVKANHASNLLHKMSKVNNESMCMDIKYIHQNMKATKFNKLQAFKLNQGSNLYKFEYFVQFVSSV